LGRHRSSLRSAPVQAASDQKCPAHFPLVHCLSCHLWVYQSGVFPRALAALERVNVCHRRA
jgi:hypothetical protein